MDISLKPHERIDRLEREKIAIIQSPEVFSFSLDAVLLADFANVPRTRPGKIVDLCAGNGAVSFLLSAKTTNPITAVELQEELCDMAQRSIHLNHLEEKIQLIQSDIRQLNSLIPKDSVDVITCNPPYFKVEPNSMTNKRRAYTIARHEIHLPMEDLARTIAGLLKMRGKAYIVHRPDRLSDLITIGRHYRLEPKRIQFVHPKSGRDSNIVLLEWMKDGQPGGLHVLPPITVFDDNGEYTDSIRTVLWGKQ